MRCIRHTHILTVAARRYEITRPSIRACNITGFGTHAFAHVKGANIAETIASFFAWLTKAATALFARWGSDVLGWRRVLEPDIDC